MRKKDVHIVLSSSNEFLPYCATTMASILDNLSDDYMAHFYILSFDITNKNKEKLAKLSAIKKCVIEYPKLEESMLDMFEGIRLPSHVTKMTFARLLIPTILKTIDKAIFIDSDTLVRGDISTLYNLDLGENCIGAVEDVDYINLSKILFGKVGMYYNGGVLVFNLKKMRDMDYVQIMKNKIRENGRRYLICDQSVMNDCFIDKIKKIPCKYNLFHIWHSNFNKYVPVDDLDFEKSVREPIVIHFVGKNKPWYFTVEHQYKEEYLKYYKKQPFYNKSKIFYFDNYKTNSEILKTLRIRSHTIFSWKKTLVDKILTLKILGCSFSFKIREKNKFKNKKEIKQYIEIQKEILFNASYKQLLVKEHHSKVLPEYKNIYKDKSVVILGSGPTLNNYVPIKKAITIALNRSFMKEGINVDYIFAWDLPNLLKNDPLFYVKIKKHSAKKILGKFLSDNVEQVSEETIKSLNALSLYSSARHNILNNWIEQNIFYDIEKFPLMDFGSVSFGAFHFALYAGAEKIYLVGLDNSLNGYFNKEHKQQFLFTEQIYIGWLKVRDFVKQHYPNVKIVSINPIGLRGIFEDVYTEDFLKDHPEIERENLKIIS